VKWEYKVEFHDLNPQDTMTTDVSKFLNTHGKNGWECYQITLQTSFQPVIAFFKRQVK